ncbi:hypothetical protein GGX14DRAFT_678725 [Mycena pura]|uniref:Uncharacterized protein n=1 Tax=Mycena pura TaxID=153505 RepID=A0AAD6UTY4_9AGAR|nr:hypothetical protein GGX14DRAFT_678725 [Mycena pura]
MPTPLNISFLALLRLSTPKRSTSMTDRPRMLLANVQHNLQLFKTLRCSVQLEYLEEPDTSPLPVSTPSAANRVLRLNRGSVASVYVQLYVAFFISDSSPSARAPRRPSSWDARNARLGRALSRRRMGVGLRAQPCPERRALCRRGAAAPDDWPPFIGFPALAWSVRNLWGRMEPEHAPAPPAAPLCTLRTARSPPRAAHSVLV